MVIALQKFGRHIFLEEQEASALGGTWRAAELEGGKIVENLLADVIGPNLAKDPGFRDQYQKQSSLSAKLEHPNILRKVSTVSEGEELFSFYEYQEGFSLEKVMKRIQSEGNPFSVDHSLLVVSKLLSALAYAKTKHLTHGFVNPSMIFVTHEGEIKLKGIAFSSALRAARSAPPLSDYYRNYVPAGISLTSEDRDRMDIYGSGAILYEMLIGLPYEESSDVVKAMSLAVTAYDGEPIPPKIANILAKSLGSGYKDIQKMTADMDELLFSGEYSPTTFNLAFFMHSAFRQEMEALGEKAKIEKARDYSTHVPAPTPVVPVARPAAMAAPVVTPPPRAAAAPAPAPAKKSTSKSKTPILIGVAVLIAIILVIVLGLPKGEPEDDSAISKLQGELRQEGKEQLAAQKVDDQKELLRQNEDLKEMLRLQAEQEIQRKQSDLEDEMAQIDKRIEDAKRNKEAQTERKTQQAELERVRKELAALQAAKKPEPAPAPVPVKTKPKTEEASTVAKAESDTGKTLETPAPKEPKKEPVATPDASLPLEPPVSLKPPNEGDLVLLTDEQLRRPELLQIVPQLKAPRKAVREGAIAKNKPAYYIMRILVNEKGLVEQATLQRRSLPKGSADFGMEEEAREVAMNTRWSSPTKQGVPVKVWSYVTVSFYAK